MKAKPSDADIAEPPKGSDNGSSSPLGGLLKRRKAKKPAPAKAEPTQAAQTPEPIAPPPEKPGTGSADETDRMTVFGAREGQSIGGKPRHLGLILTVLLLVGLAAVAAWASVFLDRGLTGLLLGPDDRELAATPEPAPPRLATTAPARLPSAPQQPSAQQEIPPADVDPPASSVDPVEEQAQEKAPVQLATLPESATETPQPPALSDTDAAVLDALRDPSEAELETEPAAEPEPTAPSEPEQVADPELEPEPEPIPQTEMEATYAATGIWDQPPVAPDTPGIVSLDDLYLASIDRTDLAQDAVALPAPDTLKTDIPPVTSSAPAAPGARFDLNAEGLVDPTPEGTLNPDGVMVYLGRPSSVPPPTPTRFETDPEETADPAEELATVAAVRPILRPEDLEEQAERAQLGGLSLDELGRVRPLLRPRDYREPPEQVAPDPAVAALASVRPILRPANFTPPTSRASTATPSEPSSDTSGNGARSASLAAQPRNDFNTVAPRTVKPKVPSSAAVAKRATSKNSINLRNLNLIGVYGTPANRRALVRLPSGRYKKVKVGDTVDGGRITAIGDSELRYQKGGRNLTLKIPSG